MASPSLHDKADKDVKSIDHDGASDDVSIRKGDLLSLESLDPVLNAKMHMVNDVRQISTACVDIEL
jgi:hypothetical protein